MSFHTTASVEVFSSPAYNVTTETTSTTHERGVEGDHTDLSTDDTAQSSRGGKEYGSERDNTKPTAFVEHDRDINTALHGDGALRLHQDMLQQQQPQHMIQQVLVFEDFLEGAIGGICTKGAVELCRLCVELVYYIGSRLLRSNSGAQSVNLKVPVYPPLLFGNTLELGSGCGLVSSGIYRATHSVANFIAARTAALCTGLTPTVPSTPHMNAAAAGDRDDEKSRNHVPHNHCINHCRHGGLIIATEQRPFLRLLQQNIQLNVDEQQRQWSTTPETFSAFSIHNLSPLAAVVPALPPLIPAPVVTGLSWESHADSRDHLVFVSNSSAATKSASTVRVLDTLADQPCRPGEAQNETAEIARSNDPAETARLGTCRDSYGKERIRTIVAANPAWCRETVDLFFECLCRLTADPDDDTLIPHAREITENDSGHRYYRDCCCWVTGIPEPRRENQGEIVHYFRACALQHFDCFFVRQGSRPTPMIQREGVESRQSLPECVADVSGAPKEYESRIISNIIRPAQLHVTDVELSQGTWLLFRKSQTAYAAGDATDSHTQTYQKKHGMRRLRDYFRHMLMPIAVDQIADDCYAEAASFKPNESELIVDSLLEWLKPIEISSLIGA